MNVGHPWKGKAVPELMFHHILYWLYFNCPFWFLPIIFRSVVALRYLNQKETIDPSWLENYIANSLVPATQYVVENCCLVLVVLPCSSRNHSLRLRYSARGMVFIDCVKLHLPTPSAKIPHEWIFEVRLPNQPRHIQDLIGFWGWILKAVRHRTCPDTAHVSCCECWLPESPD